MSEPTKTRAQLRRELTRRMGMVFRRRLGESSTLTGSSSTTAARDSAKLVQTDDFWNGHYFYNVTRDAVRLITDFVAANDEATLEYAITGQVSGDTYEIHSLFSADDLHGALNVAIRDGFPAFFDYLTDESLVLEQDTLEYDLSSLATAPYRVKQVFIESAVGVLRGVVDDADTTYITDDALIGAIYDGTNSLDLIRTGWKVSIYAGTGAGQVRTVASTTPSTGKLSISGADPWDTTPDTTSKYAVWNPAVQWQPWRRVTVARFDAKEWPDKLYLGRIFPEWYGLRLRIKYIGRPAELSAEASTTLLPEEYLMERAQAYLYALGMDDNRLDRARYSDLYQTKYATATQLKNEKAWREPDGTLWQEEAHLPGYGDNADPLGWRNY
jgi:hypothetical protein